MRKSVWLFLLWQFGCLSPLDAAEIAPAVRAERSVTLDVVGNSQTRPRLPVDEEAIRIHTETLADDAFEGREAGQAGGHGAATYIIRKLKEYNIQPAGADGSYFQSFGRGFRNILAVIPGKDEELAEQYLLVSAHYDHVGRGSKANSNGTVGLIHNGADDNASGIASLLELAKTLANQDMDRSVLIVFWDAEEKGLLGSKHWLKSPTIDLESLRYVVNIDMIGRLRERLLVFGSRTMPGLRLAWTQANTVSDLELEFPWEVINNSDHYSFFERRFPVTMIHTGLHDDYHTASDDVHLLNHDGIRQVTELLATFVVQTANRETLPAFRAASLKERKHEQRYYERPYRARQRRLGISVKTNSADQGGLVIEAVWVGSPANRAGIKPGTRVRSANGRPMLTIVELQDQIRKAKKEITLQVEEAGQVRDVTIQLVGNPQRIGVSWRSNDAEPGVVTLSGVVPRSPADLAGCKPLDRVIAVDGERIAGGEDFRQRMEELKDGCELLLERGGRFVSASLEVQ